MGGAGKPRPRLRRALATAKASLSRGDAPASHASTTSARSLAGRTSSGSSDAAPRARRVATAAPTPRGGMLFDAPHDRALADRQRSSIRYIACRLGGQLLSGSVSLKSTAMPVHLNEPRSFLQRLTDDLFYARALLDAAAAPPPAADDAHVGGARGESGGAGGRGGDRATDGVVGGWSSDGGASGEALAALGTIPGIDAVAPAAATCTDPARRLAIVAAFLVSGLHTSATVAKAFNPQIGETYSASFGPPGDQTRVYLEQTRHHPPVSHFTATPASGAYTLCGYSSFDSQFRFAESALLTRRTGITAVDFGGDPADRIAFTHPTVVVRGILTGDRRVDVTGVCSLYYERYNLVMDLLFDPLAIATAAHSPTVAAVASLIPNPFTLFSTAPPDPPSTSLAADARDSSGDAVRGVLYQILPGSRTAASGAFAPHDPSSPSYYGDPDAVAASLTARSADGSCFSSGGVPAPAELRADEQVAASVAAAWSADVPDDEVAPPQGDDASPDTVRRRILALASGSWLSHFDVAGARLWDLNTPRHDVVPPPLDEALPSDSRHREDIVALEKALAAGGEWEAALDDAQAVKERLENVMRAESKVRPVPELVTDPFFPTCLAGVAPK